VVLLIPLGITLLIFHAVPHLGTSFSLIIDRILNWLYSILQFIEQLPFSVQRISLSPVELTFLTGFILSVFILIETRRVFYLKATLAFVALLLSSSILLKVKKLNEKQIIVYNDTDNAILHLISRKKNYIISENEIKENDYSLVTINNTVNYLHLAEPVFLLANQNYNDQFLLLNNGFLIFQNKSILVNPKQIPNSPDFIPEIIINPLNYKTLKKLNIQESLIVSNNMNLKREATDAKQIHILQLKGAYLKKW
jgi:competence protein ComEC